MTVYHCANASRVILWEGKKWKDKDTGSDLTVQSKKHTDNNIFADKSLWAFISFSTQHAQSERYLNDPTFFYYYYYLSQPIYTIICWYFDDDLLIKAVKRDQSCKLQKKH